MKKPDFSLASIEPFFEKISQLSQLQRVLISCGIFLIFISAFVYFLYYPKFKEINKLNDSLEKLQKELKIAKKNAKDLKKFKSKIKEAEDKFKVVMKSLPEKEEIPSLLSSVSLSGRDSGLEFLLFQPKGEIARDFYAEIPVAMRVNGKYHNVALFFDKVARLPRVVNIKNIVMKPAKGDETLSTQCTAVTYKFIDKPAQKKKSKKKTRKSKRKK
ncbi:MAG: type 4a pilus biogenesis protein PilO [Deltaproteobacteria bacterium]|nr:MAG: type 4a pilus biogenesis protein PilO [Deltaproteobacteria bacterium]